MYKFLSRICLWRGKIEVFLCSKFWTAPETGVDTKFGILPHEVSHEVAGTKDNNYRVADHWNCVPEFCQKITEIEDTNSSKY